MTTDTPVPAEPVSSPPDADSDMEIRRLQRLAASAELVARYEWPIGLLDMEPHDPILIWWAHYMVDANKGGNEAAPREQLEAFRAVATHFVTPAARRRLLDEVERRLEDETDLTGREDLRLVALALARPSAPLTMIGLVMELLQRDVVDAVRRRAELAAGKTAHPLIAGALKDAETIDESGVEAMAERLAAFGEEAAPFLAEALSPQQDQGSHERLPMDRAIVKALGRIPTRCSIHALMIALITDHDGRLATDVAESLLAIGEGAVETAWGLLRFGMLPASVRLRMYEAMARHPDSGVASAIMDDLDEARRHEDGLTDAVFLRLVDALIRTNDRRAVPHLIHMLRRKSIPQVRRDALRARLQKSPWWNEINVALQRLKVGKPVFIRAEADDRAAETPRQRGRKAVKPKVVSDEERDLLNEAYYEVFDWQRPVDILAMRDSEALAKIGSLRQRDYRTYCLSRGLDGREPEHQKDFDDDWLVEGHAGLDGQPPWAAMLLAETKGMPPREARQVIQSHADTLYEYALDLAETNEPERALKRVNAVLAAQPDHSLAARLRDRIQGRAPTPRLIIVPGR